MKKIVSALVLGALAAAAYLVLKNREKSSETTNDDKIVYFIGEDGLDIPAGAEESRLAEEASAKEKNDMDA